MGRLNVKGEAPLRRDDRREPQEAPGYETVST